ncbi:MAG: anti-sigma factor [Thermoleophilia bacterium]
MSEPQPGDDVRDLVALLALDALDGEERASAESAVAADPVLQAELASHREALGLLVPDAPAPAGLWDRIALELDDPAAATTAEPEAPLAPVLPLRRRRAPLVGGVAAAAAAIAAAVAITIAVAGGDEDPSLGRLAATAGLVAQAAPGPVEGAVHLFSPDVAGGVLVVDLQKVPPAPAGHHYELWVLRRDSTHMEAVGTFVPTDDSTHLELPLPGPGEYAAFDISIQADGGPPEHSGVSLANASFS